MLCPVLALGQSVSRVSVQPHAYGGPRGAEPRQQVLLQGLQSSEKPGPGLPLWQVRLHGEAEAVGRKDTSFDLDRIWIQTPLSEDGATFVWGRVHPWDLSANPEALRPWGYLAQGQAQNRGVLLGYGWARDRRGSQPEILGWFGAHFWSDASQSKDFQFGFSVTPLFVPNLGSDLSLTDGKPSAGRFARRPPGSVEIGNSVFPIQYAMESHLKDILLQPQFMAQARWRLSPALSGWVSLARSPSINPDFSTSEILDVRGEAPTVFARVRPDFPERWQATLTHTLALGQSPWRPTLFATLGIVEKGSVGWESGFTSRYLELSVLNEKTQPVTGKFLTTEAPYAARLFQGEVRIPGSALEGFLGSRVHLKGSDLWVYGGIRSRLSGEVSLDVGADVFAGSESTYFGEWRTNDRLYAVLTWGLGS